MKASIIVITRNRAAYLHQVLKSLIGQETQGEAYEIIVVDNNSKDATPQVLKDFNRAFGDRIQYVFEPEIGMPKARNAGASVAKGEILLFIDDDAIASSNWLDNYAYLYKTFPDIVAWGGKIDLVFQSCRPKWLSDDLMMALSYLNISDKETLLSFPDYPFGCNFSVRKECYMKIGGFIEDLKTSNEEKAFFYKLYLNNYKVGYSPKALVYHQIPQSRLEIRYFIKRGIKQGIGNINFYSIFNPTKTPRFKDEFNRLLFDGLITIRNVLFYRSTFSFAQIYYLCIRWGQILGIIMRSFAKNEYRSHNQKNEASQPSFRI
jgi:glycosyltransferase involved in cell wall biosynthesis